MEWLFQQATSAESLSRIRQRRRYAGGDPLRLSFSNGKILVVKAETQAGVALGVAVFCQPAPD